MKIRSYSILAVAALVAVPATAPSASAQEPSYPRVQNRNFVYMQGSPKGRAEFVATEMAFDTAPVKGAPYSAEAVSETVQTLGDGNRIVHSSRSQVYRDSEGRSRREHTLNAIGPWVSSGESKQVVSINDPVAGFHYILTPDEKTARKLPAPRIFTSKDDGKTWKAREGGDVVMLRRDAEAGVIEKGEKFERVIVQGVPGPMAGAEGAVVMAEPLRTRVGGGPAGGFRVEMAEPKDAKTEELGSRTFDGVEATGTRTTVTIAAGEIGNERPIEIVSERWYSNDLQTVVMSRHSDPRFGETTFRLANISRSEPDRSLFEVPSDFTIEDVDATMNFKVRRELESKKAATTKQ